VGNPDRNARTSQAQSQAKTESIPVESFLMSQTETIEIVVNDQPLSIAQGSSVTDLLKVLDVRTKAIAVEINQVVVPNQDHASTVLNADDRLEVVTLVGGG
jgi:sulfur carrier protein